MSVRFNKMLPSISNSSLTLSGMPPPNISAALRRMLSSVRTGQKVMLAGTISVGFRAAAISASMSSMPSASTHRLSLSVPWASCTERMRFLKISSVNAIAAAPLWCLRRMRSICEKIENRPSSSSTRRSLTMPPSGKKITLRPRNISAARKGNRPG